ncbi:hypothetical protein RYX36_015171, partial [Vicia faba]
ERIKTCSRKNATPAMDISYDEGRDGEVFINADAKQRFTSSISRRGMHSERGFTFDREDANLGLPGRIGSLIKLKKWTNLSRLQKTFHKMKDVASISRRCKHLFHVRISNFSARM